MNRKRYITIFYIFFILSVLTACKQMEEEKVEIINTQTMTYSNPFELVDEWADYGNGDPYVLRHNGMYYLYVSTKDGRVGIKAWSSHDLINWNYEGLVTEEKLTTTAYAPEVVYWNGTFYMYTSPAGNGHYVLSSKSPTGPFKTETGNLGMSIDGSVFIDDDGSWYFTHSGHNGIVGHKMKDPYTFEEGIETNVFLNHWTEGSQIIKNNDLYYMTYTGNHVFSKGYRINYAVSSQNPLEGYDVPDHNPILISTTEEFNGLGHNSLVMGPNLDSYYIVYHNLVGRSAEGPPVRKMNIDRLIFNGSKLDVLGPTNYSTPIPDMPDFEKRWPKNETLDQNWLSETKTGESFIAEFNFEIPDMSENAKVETQFSYQSSKTYGAISIDPKENKIHLLKVNDGDSKILGSATVPAEFDFKNLHTIRVENRKNETIVFFDGMKKITVENIDFGSGEIGYLIENAKMNFGYTAFSNQVNHSSDYELYKPLPGVIEAIHYLEGENRGYYVKEPTVDGLLREKVPISLRDDGSYSILLENKGDWLKYKVNAKETGVYEISAVVNPDSVNKNFTLGLSIDDGNLKKFKVEKNNIDNGTNSYKVRLGKIHIEEGFHVLKLRLESGEIEIDHLELYQVTDEEIDIDKGLENIEAVNIHGQWQQSKDGLISNANEDMKLYTGEKTWTDLEAELTFEINNPLMDEAGLLLRVDHESNFEHQVQDSLIGYYIAFTSREITLKKLNYDSTILDSAWFSFDENTEYHLRVTVRENDIKIYLNHNKEPIITYKDPKALMKGKVGIRSEYSEINFKSLKIKSLEN